MYSVLGAQLKVSLNDFQEFDQSITCRTTQSHSWFSIKISTFKIPPTICIVTINHSAKLPCLQMQYFSIKTFIAIMLYIPIGNSTMVV